ncbi:sulfatase [Rhodopirellula sp. SWK7]|uniref:sulfatase n=1 Tax=Rhodopirellula sp. SWK7 TaxID=595460 RepID=UPI0002BEFFB1|nr:sulfatase [Rhodopirellula sp. SWK7]EMI45764.1 arylsulfatase [Rhodopirellula sp. SWK7]
MIVRSIACLLSLSGLSMGAAHAANSGNAGSSASDRPNVLFILADDLGLHDISVEGSTFYQTPNIDELALGGARFTNGYANCQVCSPSRASIQTGKYTPRHGVTDWIGAGAGKGNSLGERLYAPKYALSLPLEDITIAEAMRDAGYTTFFAGKWHLGGEGSLPTDHGYQINRGGFDRGGPPGGYFSPYQNPLLEDGPDGESLPLRLARETSQFIQEHQDKPFFAMLSFYSVHGPIQSSRPLWQKYRDIAAEGTQPSSRFKVDRTMPVRQVQDHPVYAGMMESLDTAVGNVLETIRDCGMDRSTIVVFTGDNGGVSSGDGFSTSNLPLRGGKGRQWEGGIREPYYIRYPEQIQPGTICDYPATGADLYPTILDLCGLPLLPKQHVDGVALTPVMKDGQLPERPLFWHYPHYGNQGGEPSSIIRKGDWKLIHYYEDGHDELYNLADDPGESNNLSLHMPVTTKRLAEELNTWLTDVNARLPSSDPSFDPAKAEAKAIRYQTSFKQSLEKAHAAMLDPNWKPNADWWGSLLPND